MVVDDSGASGARSAPLVDLLRESYLQRRSGRFELAPESTLFIRRGEAHIDRESQPEISTLLARAAGRPGDPELRTAAEKLARELMGGVAGGPRTVFRQDSVAAVELVGPLPTAFLLLELSTHGAGERDLLERLGGEGSRVRASNATPALQQLPGLDPEMARAMMVIEQPVAVGELLRSAPQRQMLLRGLVKLWSVGLAVLEGAPKAAGGSEIVSARALQRFLERISESLEDQRVQMAAETHRAFLAELIGHMGERNYYELLGLQLDAGEEKVLSAYNELARKVHPEHAARLGLLGREDTLRMLFERVTEAYLTLADPVRRSSYNTLMGLHQKVQVQPEQRSQEKRQLARTLYQRGVDALASMDYSTAVDLLKEAARMDPNGSYWLALGNAQAKNPNWRHHAVESFERALELMPDDVAANLAFAQVLEQQGAMERAKKHFQKVLTLMPQNPAAQDGLFRLGIGADAGATPARSLKSVLGWRTGR
jgi:tetratricopeptide (TPR) repeat protein